MTNPYLLGNFAPVLEERTDDHPLPVTGVVPPDLEGRLLRNGPNPAVIPADDTDYHWFIGDGMVHAISLAGGQATGYRNRWVRTRKLAGELGTRPPRGPLEPIDGPANTHVIRHAGTTLALVESGFPHALSPDLERARIHDFDGALASPLTAHPKRDPRTGELFCFGYDVFGPPFLRTHVVDATGALTRTEAVELPRATMIHDVGVTATRFVLLDLPVVFDLDLAAAGRTLPFRWMPEAGARVGVMPRRGSGDDVRWLGIEPCYVFHVLNAYDEGDQVVMDVVRYDRAFDTQPGEPIAGSLPHLARWTIDPTGDRVTERVLDDTPVEFPRIDDVVSGYPHRYGYCATMGPELGGWAEQPGNGLADPADPSASRRPNPYRDVHPAGLGGLVKYDLRRDGVTRFDPGPHRTAGEPVFVRAQDGRDEDEGWVLSVVYDATRDASDLVILDGTAFAGPPVATVELPARVPFGFHGSWVPSTS